MYYNQQYYQTNKSKLQNKAKENFKKNHEHRLKQMKEYYKNNKKNILSYHHKKQMNKSKFTGESFTKERPKWNFILSF